MYMKKKRVGIAILAAIVVLAAIAVILACTMFASSRAEEMGPARPTGGIGPISDDIERIRIGDDVFTMEVVDEREERGLGLSGRKGLAEGYGMLFVFPEPGIYPFWMKDMHFPIDILWVDEHGKIVHVADFITPDTYPTAFAPDEEALYVLEFPVGTARTKGINEGDIVSIER